MTEAEWFVATDPTPMLEFLERKASDRKLRLLPAELWLVVDLKSLVWKRLLWQNILLMDKPTRGIWQSLKRCLIKESPFYKGTYKSKALVQSLPSSLRTGIAFPSL